MPIGQRHGGGAPRKPLAQAESATGWYFGGGRPYGPLLRMHRPYATRISGLPELYVSPPYRWPPKKTYLWAVPMDRRSRCGDRSDEQSKRSHAPRVRRIARRASPHLCPSGPMPSHAVLRIRGVYCLRHAHCHTNHYEMAPSGGAEGARHDHHTPSRAGTNGRRIPNGTLGKRRTAVATRTVADSTLVHHRTRCAARATARTIPSVMVWHRRTTRARQPPARGATCG